MSREVRQRGNQPRPAEERVAEGFVPEQEVSVTETAKELGGQDRRLSVNEPGLKIRADKINLEGEVKYENDVDTVVKHEVPVGIIIAFDVFDNPVSDSEKTGRVMVDVNGDIFGWHGHNLATVSKKDEVVKWLGNNYDVATKFPNGIVFEWADIETGLE